MMATPRTKNKLGQYFTPTQICEFMVSLSSKPITAHVLEPSSGKGAFLDALNSAGFQNVVGVEIDSEIASHDTYPVENASFITWETDKLFDLVIGNPPYIRWKDLEDEQKTELMQHWLFGSMVNSLSDYLLPFIALSIEKLKAEGELIFITPSFWLQTKHSEPLREYLSSHGRITDLVDFGESKIFKDVSTSLVIFKFVKTAKPGAVRLHRFVGEKVGISPLDLQNSEVFKSEVISHLESKGKFVPAFDAEVHSPLALESECSKNGKLTCLGEVVIIANGMVTGLDNAFKLTPEFVAQLASSELEGVSKVVKGKDLQRLVSSNFSYYIDIDPNLSEQEVASRFPSLLRVLEPWKDKLLRRYVNGTDLEWWQWSFYRSSSFHRNNARKGFVPGKERLSHKPYVRFSLAAPDAIATQDVTAFAPLPGTEESIAYIVGFLNLPAVSAWVRTFGLMKGGVAEFSEKPLSEIPFRRIDWSNPSEAEAHQRITALIESVGTTSQRAENIEARVLDEFAKLMPELATTSL
jgi:adenine-specific DNA-methyltransferase